ncbi:unnamed protein product [Tenebrio molitor]|nr:unnamed protein product [Tenebrio molitor]
MRRDPDELLATHTTQFPQIMGIPQERGGKSAGRKEIWTGGGGSSRSRCSADKTNLQKESRELFQLTQQLNCFNEINN